MNVFNRIRELNERFREKIGWKILDSYLLKKMLGTVVFAISLLMTIVVVFDVSENIQRFMSHNIPAKEVITGYYFNFIPYFINLFIPLFTFISVIWFTSKLSSRNEIISIFDNGISFNRMLVPYIVGAVFIMLLSLVLANFIVPTTNKKLNDFKYQYFGRKNIATTYLHIKNSKNSYVFVERWDKMEETGYNFTYEEFEETRNKLINDVKSLMIEADKKFLISFESGQPEWDGYEFEYFKNYPSVQWKFLNLKKLAKQNPQKLQENIEKLCNVLLVM